MQRLASEAAYVSRKSDATETLMSLGGRSTAPRRFVADARSLAKAIGIGRTSVVVGVAVLSGLLVLLIKRYLGSEGWQWADAVADFVQLVATTVIIVGLLAWYRQRRWQQAEWTDLRSLTLMAHLIATGWSSPKNIGPPDLDPAAVRHGLEQQAVKLAQASADLDDRYQQLDAEAGILDFIRLARQRWRFELYYAEGSRERRLRYLSLLVDAHLPGLIERRDDPNLFALFVALRDDAVRATASANHADAVIREQIFLDRPPILMSYLGAQNVLSAIDPVAVLARAIEYATNALSKPGGPPDDAFAQLAFAKRCVGAVRNELQWVVDALYVLNDIIVTLAADIRDAAERTRPV
jgi:hypothetical protein